MMKTGIVVLYFISLAYSRLSSSTKRIITLLITLACDMLSRFCTKWFKKLKHRWDVWYHKETTQTSLNSVKQGVAGILFLALFIRHSWPYIVFIFLYFGHTPTEQDVWNCYPVLYLLFEALQYLYLKHIGEVDDDNYLLLLLCLLGMFYFLFIK